MVDALAAGLTGVLDAAERSLVGSLGLAEVAGDPSLALMIGEARGRGLVMRTRWFAGAGVERLVIARIDVDGGGPRTVTILGFPEPARGLPILAIDLIALGGALSLAAIDLAPIDDGVWGTSGAPLLRACQERTQGRVVPRAWPEFALEVFSPLALIAGARRGQEDAVFAAATAVIEGYAGLVAASAGADADADADARRRRLAAWRAAERRNRREHDALSRLFGAEAAERYLVDLFGEAGH